MNDRELYQRILGLVAPWEVLDIRLSFADRNVTVVVGHAAGKRMACSVCGVLCGVYDHRPRRWRHLDTCQLQTVIEASVPRVSCPEHGNAVTFSPKHTQSLSKIALDIHL
jgi:transposase